MRDCKRIEFGIIERRDSKDDSFPLKVKVTLAKTGVLEYLRSDGSVSREAKLPEDLFHNDTIASLKGAPITMEHPEGLVGPANSKDLVKGSIMDSVEPKNGTLIGNGVIYDSDLIKRIKAGEKNEVSIGFTHRLEEKDGEINGENYNYIQRDILVNHVAATDSGRAGSEVRIHLDSNDKSLAIQKTDSVTKEFDNMKKVILTLDADIIKKLGDLGKILKTKDTEHVEKAAEQIAEVATALTAAAEQNEPIDSIAELATAKQQITELEAQIGGLQAVIEQMKQQIQAATNPEAQDERLESRSKIVQVAQNVLDDFKSDGKTNDEIMVEVANKIMPTKDGKDKLTKDSKDFIIKVRYDAAVEVARFKSLLGGHQGDKRTVKTDEAEINKLRDNRLNLKGKFGKKKE